MVSSAIRRPLPALVALLALLLLTGLVWWRVLHRGTSSDAATPCPTTSTAPRTTLPGPSKVTATVLNATTRTGIAASTRRTLIEAGFQVPKLAANAPKSIQVRVNAQLRFGAKGKQGATLLHYYFPGATLIQTDATSSVVYVVLGNRYKSVASASAVTKALASDKVAVTGATPATAAASTPPGC